jgi:hypothetical protein
LHDRADPAACSFPPAVLCARFLLYRRNIENLIKDRAAPGQEIGKSVAELFDAALESRAAIAIKGAAREYRTARWGWQLTVARFSGVSRRGRG